MLKLDGTVNIPWARITVHEVPESAVSATSDEVMLDDNLQPIREKQTSIPILSNLRIHIGDDVLLDAFGLKAKLTGDLKVARDKQGLGLNGRGYSARAFPCLRAGSAGAQRTDPVLWSG